MLPARQQTGLVSINVRALFFATLSACEFTAAESARDVVFCSFCSFNDEPAARAATKKQL
jgi:hypothetical protein